MNENDFQSREIGNLTVPKTTSVKTSSGGLSLS